MNQEESKSEHSNVLSHPTKGSFSHAIADTALNILNELRHTVIYHDLYEGKFDPLLPSEEIPKGADLDPVVDMDCAELVKADGIIIIHPNWWGQPPAIVKGWIDRVIRIRVVFEFAEGNKGDGIPIGLLRAKAVLVFNTSNTP